LAKTRVAVLISGRGSNMAALLYAAKAADCPFAIVLVVSNDPEAEGLVLAKAEGVTTFAHSHKGLSRDDFDALIDAEIAKARADFVALAGYLRLLSPAFVVKWEGRMLNIHPSLLPAHKGLNTHAAVLAAGERVTGCTVHLVTPELDSGAVLGQTEVAVLPDISFIRGYWRRSCRVKPIRNGLSPRFASGRWRSPRRRKRCRTACLVSE
jgi:phosphoribosylglycinamide formyltransferase 1